MGNQQILLRKMALSLFESSLFPTMGRSMRRQGFPVFGDFDRHFAEMDAQRNSFLRSMEVEPNESEEGEQRNGYTSYSSVQTGGAEPMTTHRQTYRGPDGQMVERSSQAIGDRSVTRSLKNNETNQTLHNMTEAEL